MGDARNTARPAGLAPTVCLAMIVRNEAAVIERCLRSARPWIDQWLICDTGSTDDTKERVRASLSNLPGALVERPWVDFGHTRSELLRLARGRADYLLLLDADMTVACDDESGPPLVPSDGADAYLLQIRGEPEYRVPLLVRSCLPWRYEGVTHEYLTIDQAYVRAPLDRPWIVHHADGGARADKFERDLALLERRLAERPDDARAVFYLAQTHRDLGHRQEAARLYARRADMGGWAEEAFYARYQQGLLVAPEAWPEAMALLLSAWNARPSRAEPLHALAAGCRERGQYALAHLFASRGMAIAKPDDILFVSPWIYAWGLRFEYSVAVYWMGDIAAALAATQVLAARSDIPEPWRQHVIANLRICEEASKQR